MEAGDRALYEEMPQVGKRRKFANLMTVNAKSGGGGGGRGRTGMDRIVSCFVCEEAQDLARMLMEEDRAERASVERPDRARRT